MSSGYGKPPKNGQFKKGQSGNRKGRPRKPSEPVSTAYRFRKIANERVVLETGSGKTSMTHWEALVRMVQNLALNKDPSAARVLSQMRKKFPGKAPPCRKVYLGRQRCRYEALGGLDMFMTMERSRKAVVRIMSGYGMFQVG